MLIAEDPQLHRIRSPFGWVDFCQIVGVTDEELNQASWWKGTGVLNLLSKDPQTVFEFIYFSKMVSYDKNVLIDFRVANGLLPTWSDHKVFSNYFQKL